MASCLSCGGLPPRKPHAPGCLENLQISRQRRWQLRQAAQGKCQICGRTNDRQGQANSCSVCRSRHKEAGF